MKRLVSLQIGKWPSHATYGKRYFVPDLSPEQRPQLEAFHPKLIFIAESPHVSEVAPEKMGERRPLCGKAGQEWWKMITGVLSEPAFRDTELETLLRLCIRGKFAVMNAVQYPLDPKIIAQCGPAADPVKHLGFSKVPPASFKKLKSGSEVQAAIALLCNRLNHPSVREVPVVSLGNDAQWFVNFALGETKDRHLETVPHPSAWWRQGGKLREKARGQLTRLIG